MRHGGVAVLLGVVAIAVAAGCSVVVPGNATVSADDAETVTTSRPRTSTPRTTTKPPTTTRTPGTTRRSSAPVPVDPGDYLSAPGFYRFTSESGKFACMISEEDPVLVGCYGPMPSNAPKVLGSGADDVLVPPNSVAATIDGKAVFTSIGDTLFQGLGDAARPLSYGRSLTAAGFTCTVDPGTGVTCAARLHGFTVSDTAFDLW